MNGEKKGKGGSEAQAGKPAATGKAGNAAQGAGQGKGIFPSIKLKEGDRQAAFALLAILAVGLAAYAIFIAEPPDPAADIDTFVGNVLASQNVALFFDMRNTPPEAASKIYQCGVDIAGGKLFGSKTVSTYACDDSECMAVNSAQNGSSRLTYEQVKKSLRGVPYILVKGGTPSTLFFANHAEITVDESFNASCKLG